MWTVGRDNGGRDGIGGAPVDLLSVEYRIDEKSTFVAALSLGIAVPERFPLEGGGGIVACTAGGPLDPPDSRLLETLPGGPELPDPFELNEASFQL